MNALQHAQYYANLPVRETGGKNRSPEIDEFNTYVGNPLGSPYCAAGASFSFHKSALDLPGDPGRKFPYGGGSQAIMRWFLANHLYSTDPQDLLDWEGALAGWTDPDGNHGHIFFVESRFTVSGKVTSIGTCEFNTSLSTGSRDGEGCFELRRNAPVDRGHRLWFLNTTPITGGQWWKKPLGS